MRFRKTGKYTVFHQWGDLRHISAEEADTRLLEVVLRELEDSVEPVSSDAAELRADPAERKKRARLLREYESVSISKDSKTELVIQPMMMAPRGGSGTGDPKDRVVFPLPSTTKKFVEALDIGYSRCAVVY